MRYQIYVVRDGRRETDGCWLIDEQARWFDSLDEAIEATRVLADCYPDVGWVVCDSDDRLIHEVKPTEVRRDA